VRGHLLSAPPMLAQWITQQTPSTEQITHQGLCSLRASGRDHNVPQVLQQDDVVVPPVAKVAVQKPAAGYTDNVWQNAPAEQFHGASNPEAVPSNLGQSAIVEDIVDLHEKGALCEQLYCTCWPKRVAEEGRRGGCRNCTGVCSEGQDWAHVLDVGECPYFSAVPNHRHMLRSRIWDLCLFLGISDITDLIWTSRFGLRCCWTGSACSGSCSQGYPIIAWTRSTELCQSSAALPYVLTIASSCSADSGLTQPPAAAYASSMTHAVVPSMYLNAPALASCSSV
jgi:hypothetical protein